MSDPARLFQSLYLDEMPVTRSQSNLAQQRGGRNPRGRGRGRGRAQTPAPPVAPVQAPSGLQYDTQLLSPTSASRVHEGLESSFSVDRVQAVATGRHGYYAFQLSTPVAVRIHNPASGRARVYECTCEVSRTTQSPCVHVYVRQQMLITSLTLLTDKVALCRFARSAPRFCGDEPARLYST